MQIISKRTVGAPNGGEFTVSGVTAAPAASGNVRRGDSSPETTLCFYELEPVINSAYQSGRRPPLGDPIPHPGPKDPLMSVDSKYLGTS